MPPRRPRSRRSRPPLTRERILAAALALVDRRGVQGLTMRALAEALSVEAMSLYNHVGGKAEILTAVGDRVLGMIEFPEAVTDWREAIRRAARSTWNVTSAHANVVPLLLGSPSDTPGSRALAERILELLVPAGFSPAEGHRIFRLLQAYTLGAVLMTARSPSDRAVRTMVKALEAGGEFPLLRQALTGTGPIDGEADFDAGIELIIHAVTPRRGRDISRVR